MVNKKSSISYWKLEVWASPRTNPADSPSSGMKKLPSHWSSEVQKEAHAGVSPLKALMTSSRCHAHGFIHSRLSKAYFQTPPYRSEDSSKEIWRVTDTESVTTYIPITTYCTAASLHINTNMDAYKYR